MLRLVITDSSGERTFATEKGEVLIGRRAGVDLELTEAAASRNHCVLRIEDGQVRVIDLGTVNGTKINGKKIEQALLNAGDTFRIGNTVVCVSAFSTAARPAKAQLAPASPRPDEPQLLKPAAPVPTGGGPSDFGREVRAMVRSAPWYVVSLVVHVLLLLVLDLISIRTEPPERVAHLENVSPTDVPEAENLEFDEPELGDIAPEVEDEVEDFAEEEAPSEQKSTPDAEFANEFEAPPAPTGAGATSVIKIAPLKKSPITGSEAELAKGDIENAHGRAVEKVNNRYGKGIQSTRRKLNRSEIVVVEGNFDKIQLVLDAYRWPYTLVTRETLARRPPLSKAKILFINCARRPKLADRRKLVTIVKSFVQRGGWVVTSDWALDPYITDAFPDLVRIVQPKRAQRDTTVKVEPVSNDPLLEGAFARGKRSRWWLEEASTMVQLRESSRVKVLVASAEMQKRYGSNIVVFQLKAGRGQVVHLLGHFYQQDGNEIGLVGMHVLINNLILARFNPPKRE